MSRTHIGRLSPNPGSVYPKPSLERSSPANTLQLRMLDIFRPLPLPTLWLRLSN